LRRCAGVVILGQRMKPAPSILTPPNRWRLRLPLTLLCVVLAGCESAKKSESVAELGQGYVEVAHKEHGVDPALARTSLEFRGADGKRLRVWPSLYGVDSVVHGGLAVFVGDVYSKEGGSRDAHPRLFAVESPGLPVDITDAVVWGWAKSTGREVDQALGNYSLATPAARNGRLEVKLDFWVAEGSHWPDQGVLTLDWNQVAELLRQGKQRGVLTKDWRWHVPYVRE